MLGAVGWRLVIANGLLILASLVVSCRGLGLVNPRPVTVEWTTESEVDVAGFNVLRSEHPDGPYQKINQDLIPASNDPLIGRRYVYTDTDVLPGKVYYYKLEDVDLNGVRTLYGPIKARAGEDWSPALWVGGGVVLLGAVAFVVWRRWKA